MATNIIKYMYNFVKYICLNSYYKFMSLRLVQLYILPVVTIEI